MKKKITRKQYIEGARIKYPQDGGVDITDNARITRDKDGAWVYAWVWVSDNDVPEET